MSIMSIAHKNPPKNTVLVIYSHVDGGKWPPYLKKIFDISFDYTVDFVPFKEDLIPCPLIDRILKSSTTNSKPAILVVILTPGHLNFLKSNPGVEYRQALVSKRLKFSSKSSCIIYLGVEAKDLKQFDVNGQSLERRFENLQDWRKYDYSTAEDVALLASELFAKMERQFSSEGQQRAKIICNVVKSDEVTTTAIVFKKEIPLNSIVQVHLNFPGGSSSVSTKTEILNPYTVAFTIRERLEGEADVLVHLNNEEVLLEPPTKMKFVSSANDVHTNSQIYIKFLHKLIEVVLRSKMNSAAELDDCLTKTFSPEEMMNVPSRAFERCFGVLTDVPRDRSGFHHPTLLHLAAQHDLKRLSSTLVDLPEAILALEMSNVDDKMPEDVARTNGHHDLSKFLENSRTSVLGDLQLNGSKKVTDNVSDDGIYNDIIETELYVKPDQQKRPSRAPPVPSKSPISRSPTKTKPYPRVASFGPPSSVDLDKTEVKCMEKALTAGLAEKVFHKAMSRDESQTSDQNQDSDIYLTIPNRETFSSSREYLIRKPKYAPARPSATPPPLPSRNSRSPKND